MTRVLASQLLHANRRHADRLLAASLAVLAAAAGVLHGYSPEVARFFPRCPLYQFTGLLCPGCGSTRAFAELTHGHLAEALHSNALTTLLLPVLAVYALRAFLRVRRGEALPSIPHSVTFSAILLSSAFTLVRNLP